MRILITNDDGIDAAGLRVMHDIAAQFTDTGNITTIAPATDQSGVGHCISYKKSVKITRPAPNRIIAHGTPADCVIIGLLEMQPDLILSGVNAGNNAAQNVLYSGTVGAAIEGCANGVNSIALSQFYGDRIDPNDMFSAARGAGVATVQNILDFKCWMDNGQPLFYNVNFPPVPYADIKGTRITTQGTRPNPPFLAERDGEAVRIIGTPQHSPTAQGSDVYENLNGYISITPCLMDLTARGCLDGLRAKLDGKLDKTK